MTRNKTTYKQFILVLTVFVSLTVFGQGQISVKQLDLTKLPDGIKYYGKIKTAVRWTDKSGDNIVLTTETGETISKIAPSEDYRDAALYAYHYIVVKDSTFLTWTVNDFIKECPVDIEANFVKNTFQITDLNNDGVAEVWLMYKTVCHGDISPSDMKIIMYQGQRKYAVRGQNKVRLSDKEVYGGGYKFDKAFANGPNEFLELAKKMCNKNMKEIWGE
ncbi:MAG: M949_RS01915 family surface polysaccharide biosynthesis protein [bacterium]